LPTPKPAAPPSAATSSASPLHPRRGSITLHLPEGWHREHEWLDLFEAATGPPAQAA